MNKYNAEERMLTREEVSEAARRHLEKNRADAAKMEEKRIQRTRREQAKLTSYWDNRDKKPTNVAIGGPEPIQEPIQQNSTTTATQAITKQEPAEEVNIVDPRKRKRSEEDSTNGATSNSPEKR